MPLGEPSAHPSGLPSEWRPNTAAMIRDWQWIVVHHAAQSSGDAASIGRVHRDVNKWDGLGYHFVIGNGTQSGDGEIEVGFRWREQREGAHARVRAGDDNRWVVRSWPEPLERAYYADPKVQAVESPFTQRQRAVAGGEQWTFRGENEDVAHVRTFVDAVRSRRQPVEDARFGHRAAACAHLINQSIREGRAVKWEPKDDA